MTAPAPMANPTAPTLNVARRAEVPNTHVPRQPLTHTRFLLTALATSAVNLVLNAAVYALILKDFSQAHPSGSEAFVAHLNRPPGELVVWAMAVTSLTMGLLITTVMRWSGARTPGRGLRDGAIFGVLFWVAVNSGLYASSNLFSLASVLVDTPCVALCMTLSAAFAAWLLGVKRTAAR